MNNSNPNYDGVVMGAGNRNYCGLVRSALTIKNSAPLRSGRVTKTESFVTPFLPGTLHFLMFDWFSKYSSSSRISPVVTFRSYLFFNPDIIFNRTFSFFRFNFLLKFFRITWITGRAAGQSGVFNIFNWDLKLPLAKAVILVGLLNHGVTFLSQFIFGGNHNAFD